jgi:hypothetical protein
VHATEGEVVAIPDLIISRTRKALPVVAVKCFAMNLRDEALPQSEIADAVGRMVPMAPMGLISNTPITQLISASAS